MNSAETIQCLRREKQKDKKIDRKIYGFERITF